MENSNNLLKWLLIYPTYATLALNCLSPVIIHIRTGEQAHILRTSWWRLNWILAYTTLADHNKSTLATERRNLELSISQRSFCGVAGINIKLCTLEHSMEPGISFSQSGSCTCKMLYKWKKKYEYGVCQLFNYAEEEVFKGMDFAVSYACGGDGPLSLRFFLSVDKLVQQSE